MNILRKMKAPVAGCLLLLPATATHADLTGAVISISPYYPTATTPVQIGSNKTVGLGIEYPAKSFASYNPEWQIDVTSSRIIISAHGWAGNPSGIVNYLMPSGGFNGWIFDVVSGPLLLSATSDPSSQFNPIGITIKNGNELLLNFAGVKGPNLGESIIDITTATVPEPEAPVAFLAIVLAGLGVARKRSVNATSAA